MQDIDAKGWSQAVEAQDKLVVVEFWHEQCAWCKKLAPVYDTLPGDYNNVVFARFNVLSSDENMQLAQKYGVSGTPTIKVFCNGREAGEIIGYMDREQLKKELDAIMGSATGCIAKSTAIQR